MIRRACLACLDAVLAQRDRWALWLPVAMGIGIAVYLSLAVEPPLWAGGSVAGALAMLLLAVRQRAWARLPLIVMLGVVAGFCAISLRASLVGTPMVTTRLGPVLVEGEVETFETRPGERPRLLILSPSIAGLFPAATPRRVRITLDPEMVMPSLVPGDRVQVMAMLLPPPGPAMPAAPDHGRAMWFQGIGAVGYATDVPRRLGGAGASSLGEWRHRLALRISASLPEPMGAIAAALMVGERGAVPEAVESAWRDAGISHILSISGLHLGLAAGVVMFALRFALAAIAPISLRWPVKKWAAGAAILSAAAYMVIAGMDVPAQRSFIMTAIILLAVMVDRLAITLRLVALAGGVILLVEPEALVTPGFGMSFASVAGLVAGFEGLRPHIARWRAASGGGVAGRLILALGTILVSSVIATVATAPFAIAHFGRLSLFGLVANLVAVPITAFMIMPAIVAAAVLMPLGWEAPALHVVGQGIALVDGLARVVAQWPGASLAVPAMGQWPLALFVLAGLCLCLWRSWLRLSALPFLALAGLLWLWQVETPPLLLVHGEGRAIAAPAGDRLRVLPPGTPGFVIEQWTERLGLAETEILDRSKVCDGIACRLEVAGGITVLVLIRPADALPCATIVVAPRLALPRRWDCPGLRQVIDRQRLGRIGSFTVEADEGGRLVLTGIEQSRGLRPWTPAWWRRQGR